MESANREMCGRKSKIVYLAVVLAVLALPSLSFFGAKEPWRRLSGVEHIPPLPNALTFGNFGNRAYQDVFTEYFSKTFFLRATFFTTAMQLRDWFNFGKFHYGKNGTILDGRDGVLMERPYFDFHLRFDRKTERSKYDEIFAKLHEVDDFCRSVGADFAFLMFPDKPQTYPEYIPPWCNWFWDFSLYDVQSVMAKYFAESGLKAFDANAYFRELRKRNGQWLYPPGGTHLTSVSCGYTAEAFVAMLNAGGRSDLRVNRFLGSVETNTIWSVDNDISDVLNTWRNVHARDNVHYAPRFEREGVVMNAGSAIIMGDCYRDQVQLIFRNAGLFDPKKIVISKRMGQKPEDFKDVIGDLKLVVLTFQSFNTGRLYEHVAEIDSILSAMKAARGL